MKYCYKCKTNKDEAEFSKDKSRKDGLANMCKECCKKRNKKRYEENKEEIKEDSRIYYHKNKEKCNARSKKYNKENKEKISKNKKEYYAEHKEEKKIYNKNYNKNNKEKIYKNKKEYRENNIRSFRNYRAEHKRKKYKTDISFRLRDIVSSSINSALKNDGNSKKGGSILDFLPYSMEELKQHLENQFEPWMNWGNYGVFEKDRRKWNIDHKIPQSLLVYDSMEHPNFIKCWALENLRPLDVIENIKKQAKCDEEELKNILKNGGSKNVK